MRKYKKIQVIIISLLCLTLALPVHAGSAGTAGTEQKLTTANDRLSKLQSARSDLQTYMSELNTQLSELGEALNDLDEKQSKKEQEIEQTENELEIAREREAEQYASMKMRIQYMYENDNMDFLTIVFSSENLSDMLNKLDFITQITQYDRDMLISYQETKDMIARKETELNEELAELAELHEQTVAEQNTISALLNEASSELSQFDTDIASAAQQIAAYEQELLEQEEAIRARMEAASAAESAEQKSADNSDSQKDSSSSGSTDKASADTGTNEKPSDSGSNTSNTDNTDKNTNADKSKDDEDSGNSTTSYSDLDFLAAIIECEAGGESTEGKVAVGSVVMNRVSSSRYPNSVQAVLYQSGQFAPVASGRFAVVLARGANSSCRAAASRALAGEKPVGSCLYFRTIASAQAAGITPTYTIGNHVFY